MEKLLKSVLQTKKDLFESLPRLATKEEGHSIASKSDQTTGWSVAESEKEPTGLMVTGSTQLDNQKIGEYVESSPYHAEWNAREGYWFFPEDEATYDQLEKELTQELELRDINFRIEGVFAQSTELDEFLKPEEESYDFAADKRDHFNEQDLEVNNPNLDKYAFELVASAHDMAELQSRIDDFCDRKGIYDSNERDYLLAKSTELMNSYTSNDVRDVLGRNSSEDNDNKNIINYSGDSKSPQAETQEVDENEVEIAEHHLHTREEKINYILQNQNVDKYEPWTADMLDYLSDVDLDIVYNSVENESGIVTEAKKKETAPSLKPPKEWFKKMEKKIKKDNPDYDEEKISATIGKIWYKDLTDSKRKSIRARYGKKYGKAPVKENEDPMYEVSNLSDNIDQTKSNIFVQDAEFKSVNPTEPEDEEEWEHGDICEAEKENYIERLIAEPSASDEFIQLYGQAQYDTIAQIVNNIDDAINRDELKVSDEANIVLDHHFPILTAEGLIDYLNTYAKETGSSELSQAMSSLKTSTNEKRDVFNADKRLAPDTRVNFKTERGTLGSGKIVGHHATNTYKIQRDDTGATMLMTLGNINKPGNFEVTVH